MDGENIAKTPEELYGEARLLIEEWRRSSWTNVVDRSRCYVDLGNGEVKLLRLNREGRTGFVEAQLERLYEHFFEKEEKVGAVDDCEDATIFGIVQSEEFHPCCLPCENVFEPFEMSERSCLRGVYTNAVSDVGSILLYQKIYNFSINKKKRLFSLFRGEDVLSGEMKISDHEMLVLEDRVDLFSYEACLFARSLNEFKRTEEFRRHQKKRALDRIRALEERFGLQGTWNSDSLAQYLENNPLASQRIARIKKPWFEEDDLEDDVVVCRLKSDQYYTSLIEADTDNFGQITSDSAAVLVDFLDDARLQSRISQRTYVATRKRRTEGTALG